MSAMSVLFIILVGGYTRIKNAGLSMTYWKPLSIKFPKNEEEWSKEYEEYKNFAEYKINKTGLKEFKFIFFMEYFHRMLARSMGLVFVLPLIYFNCRGYIKSRLNKVLIKVGLLGGLQAVIGWWMVKSGLEKKHDYQIRPKVSTYRLITHLSIAITIYSTLLWQSMNLLRQQNHSGAGMVNAINNFKQIKYLRKYGIAIIHLVAFNLLSGAMVAGIEAGRVYNTWPDMNGMFIPSDYLQNFTIKDLFENRATAQFNHRMFGYLTYFAVVLLFIKKRKMNLSKSQNFSINLMFSVVHYQLFMGIYTLLSLCEPRNASAHQFGGIAMLSSTLLFLHNVRKPKQFITKNPIKSN